MGAGQNDLAPARCSAPSSCAQQGGRCAHAMPGMWAVPAASPPSGVSGCSRCCLAAILGSQGRGPDRPPLDLSFRQHPLTSRVVGLLQGDDVLLLPRTTLYRVFLLDLQLVALLLQLHTRDSVSMLRCYLLLVVLLGVYLTCSGCFLDIVFSKFVIFHFIFYHSAVFIVYLY